MDTTITTIDEYINQFPPSTKAILKKIYMIIQECAPQATEKIGYGIPTFIYHGNLLHFAGYKHHIGFYPTPVVINKFQDKLTKYETSKGTIKFPLDQPIPYDLIKHITQYCVKQAEAKSK